MMEVEVVLDAGATIGESPTWATAEGALYWIDVKKPALCRYDPATGDQGSWPMPSDIGAFALAPDPHGAVVALRDGIFHLDLASGALTCLAPPPFDPGLFRFNEGAVDVTGRFWVDVMFDPLDGTPPPQKSSLHSFTLAGGLRAEPDDRDVALPVKPADDVRLRRRGLRPRTVTPPSSPSRVHNAVRGHFSLSRPAKDHGRLGEMAKSRKTASADGYQNFALRSQI
jgi:hypothetical protein